MILITAPQKIDCNNFAVFLAGSIEQDCAENWQNKVIESLQNIDITVFNPRRQEWDKTWVQNIENQIFTEQVEWELNALEQSDVILMYFDPKTKSPVSLLELGLFAKTGKMVVCCPDGFWRKGNVDIVCKKYNIKQVETLNDLALL